MRKCKDRLHSLKKVPMIIMRQLETRLDFFIVKAHFHKWPVISTIWNRVRRRYRWRERSWKYLVWVVIFTIIRPDSLFRWIEIVFWRFWWTASWVCFKVTCFVLKIIIRIKHKISNHSMDFWYRLADMSHIDSSSSTWKLIAKNILGAFSWGSKCKTSLCVSLF